MRPMFNHNNVELVHRQIILDLTIRTLERDRKYIKDLKMYSVFELWFDAKIKELQQNLKSTKSDLYKKGIKIQSEVKDGDFTVYLIIERGQEFERRYSNIALRNWCIEETKRLLGLEYKTVESGQK